MTGTWWPYGVVTAAVRRRVTFGKQETHTCPDGKHTSWSMYNNADCIIIVGYTTNGGGRWADDDTGYVYV